MRTLVLGIPLPHVTFDNYSFLSAPSLFDYARVIVETSALSEAIEQVTTGSTEHRTYGGLTVVNGPPGPAAFSPGGAAAAPRRGGGAAAGPRRRHRLLRLPRCQPRGHPRASRLAPLRLAAGARRVLLRRAPARGIRQARR